MKISVWNLKGGVGKTHLSLALAKDLKLNYYSNENNYLDNFKITHSLIEKKNLKNLKIADDSIFDFGGFPDQISDFLTISDIVLIPLIDDELSILKSYETFNIVNKFNQRIIFVITRFNKNKEQKSKILEKTEKPILFLNETNIFKKSLQENKGIIELSQDFCYKNKKIIEQYKELIKEIH